MQSPWLCFLSPKSELHLFQFLSFFSKWSLVLHIGWAKVCTNGWSDKIHFLQIYVNIFKVCSTSNTPTDSFVWVLLFKTFTINLTFKNKSGSHYRSQRNQFSCKIKLVSISNNIEQLCVISFNIIKHFKISDYSYMYFKSSIRSVWRFYYFWDPKAL